MCSTSTQIAYALLEQYGSTNSQFKTLAVWGAFLLHRPHNEDNWDTLVKFSREYEHLQDLIAVYDKKRIVLDEIYVRVMTHLPLKPGRDFLASFSSTPFILHAI